MSGAEFSIEGMAAAMHQLLAHQASLESSARQAVVETVTSVQRQAIINATGPARWVNVGGHVVNRPREGGPGVVTGNLRRSSTVTVRRIDGGIEGLVAFHAVYAAAQEFGHPAWKRGRGYPFLRPAVVAELSTGGVSRRFARIARGTIRG